MRILIIGASGFIGQYVSRRLAKCAAHDVFGTSRSWRPTGNATTWLRVEMTDTASLEEAFATVRPDVVLHLAAMADVGTAEREQEQATAVNVAGTSEVVRLCERRGARLVFVSTEYVFDGRRGFYGEDELPKPITHYGRTKWKAEQLVMGLTSSWSILRTSIVYGWREPGRRNFVPWLVERLRTGQPYLGRTDVYRTPVYVGDLVDGIVRLVEGEFQGVYHVAGRDWVSMHHFARAVAQSFGLDGELVIPDSPSSVGTMKAASGEETAQGRNPDLLGLDCARTIELLDISHPGLSEGLARMRVENPESTPLS